MATYKKRGYKKSIAPGTEKKVELESTTAEVFEKLDTAASRTEEWVSKFQNFILAGVGDHCFISIILLRLPELYL